VAQRSGNGRDRAAAQPDRGEQREGAASGAADDRREPGSVEVTRGEDGLVALHPGHAMASVGGPTRVAP
jgi:hypothetical protein